MNNNKQGGYTLTEVLVAVGVLGIMLVALYLAFSAGFTEMRVARENLRATQVMVQRAETLRLYTWTQLNDPTFFKTNFIDDSIVSLGTSYHGNITLSTPANMGSPEYLANMRTVTISVRWTNGIGKPLPHFRQMQTQVARWGIQNYVYGFRTQ